MTVAHLTPAEVTPADLIEEYLRLREKKKLAEEKFKEWLAANYTGRMDIIEAILMDSLNNLGADSLKTDVGTCFKRVETSVTVGSPAEFQRHVIGSGQWELIDFRANKTAVKAFVEDNGGETPPGVNMTQTTVLSVRRPA
jgi:hypothetical protein